MGILSTPTAAPVITRARLRRGNAASHTGAGRLLAQSITTARAAGVSGQILVRRLGLLLPPVRGPSPSEPAPGSRSPHV
ncbi:hypothetical protein YT1_p10065 (plasmid) [Rhodococcus ruber]|nr:hypothetical protein YT1_p10065 [Rhodococcus ruber]